MLVDILLGVFNWKRDKEVYIETITRLDLSTERNVQSAVGGLLSGIENVDFADQFQDQKQSSIV